MGVEIIAGDCREELRKMDADSVHCVVTSPPYFGLRDYGTSTWKGGDPSCDHQPEESWFTKNFSDSSTVGGGKNNQKAAAKRRWYGSNGSCKRCGAIPVDKQIGLEATTDAYVAEMVAVFREVRRVLRADGTFWLNLGDSYNTAGGVNNHGKNAALGKSPRSKAFGSAPGLKSKDRMMIPARVALALQADGWWLRDEIIWHKPNPMPVSVRDRTTPAHEMVYMLSKSSRYFYNMEAMKEPIADSSRKRYAQPTIADQQGGAKQDAYENGFVGQRSRSRRPNEILKSLADGGSEMRQPRSVWSIPTKPFPGAHFATFPPALVEKMILAGCPVGGTVLDPFGGSGTTGVVANQLGRNAILIDLNHEYVEMARERINGPLFAGAK